MAKTDTRPKTQTIDDMRAECYHNHWWALSAPAPEYVRTGKFLAAHYIVHKQCQKCGSYKAEGMRKNGGLIARRYFWVQGYIRDRDDERPTAEQLRLWWVRRNSVLGIPKSLPRAS